MATTNAWLKITNPADGNGSGNGQTTVTATAANTGRNPRTAILNWKGANVSEVKRTVQQAGKARFADFTNDTADVDKNGLAMLTIKGTSNAEKLTFSIGQLNGIGLTLPNEYIANSVRTVNGQSIDGDPGASAEYEFSISMEIPSNTSIANRQTQLIVSDGYMQDSIMITLAAGDAYLRVLVNGSTADSVIELAAEQGSQATVQVESNGAWEVYL